MRLRLSFNEERREHSRAMEFLDKIDARRKTDYIAECILKYEEREALRQLVSDVVKNELELYFADREFAKTEESVPELSRKKHCVHHLPDDYLNSLSDWT